MTFGHLVAHMVEANNAFCSKAADVPAPKVEEAKETDAKDKLVAALKASFDFCSDALAKMDDSKLGETTEASAEDKLRAPGPALSWPAVGPTTTPKPQCICA